MLDNFRVLMPDEVEALLAEDARKEEHRKMEKDKKNLLTQSSGLLGQVQS